MARWTRRIVALMAPLAVGAALLSILGVIASDVDATPEKPGERATGLGVELRSLAGRSVRLGRSVQRGADWARPPLREITDRAQAIEYDVRQLDSSESSRGELRRAALATAELAGVLARFQPDGADRAKRAGTAARRVEKALAEAADELDGTAGRRALRKLRRKLPTVLVAGPAPR